MRERCWRQERRGGEGVAGTRQQRRDEPQALGHPVEVRASVPVMFLASLDLIARDLAMSRHWRARLAPRQRLLRVDDRRPAKLERHLPVRALELGVVHVEVRVELVLRVVDVELAVERLREEVALARVLLHEEGPAGGVGLRHRRRLRPRPGRAPHADDEDDQL